MLQAIAHFLISALAVWLTADFLQGVSIDGIRALFIVVVVLALVNVIIRPIVMLLTFPLRILTLGILTVVIDGLLILLVARLVSGFTVESFWWAVGFSIVLAIVSVVLEFILGLFTPRKES